MTVVHELPTNVRDAYDGQQIVIGVTQRCVVNVSGPDASTYLQGQLSSDVAGLAVGATNRTLLLQPTGKLCAWLSVARTADQEFLLVGPVEVQEAVVERLTRFRLRSKLEITGSIASVIAVRTQRPVDVSDLIVPLGVQVVAVVDARWGGDQSFDLVVDPASAAVDVSLSDAVTGDSDVIAALDCWRTLPTWGAEFAADALPAEAGIVASSVSFTKGCYTGQELTARMDSRNTIPPKVLTVWRGPDPQADQGRQSTSMVTSGDVVLQLGYVARSALADQQRVESAPVAPLQLSLRS